MYKRKQFGFTIVELLIVIVIIAILAAISIVAYTGIQQRANNSQNAAAVAAFKKALIAYATVNQSYPVSVSACLGDGYPDLNSDGIGDCGSDEGVVVYSKNAAMDAALLEYGGSGNPSTKQYFQGDWMQMGVMYEHVPWFTLDSVPHPWWLTYEIGGSSEKCATYGGGINFTEYPNLSPTPQPGWHGASEVWPTAIKCWIPLPNPASL